MVTSIVKQLLYGQFCVESAGSTLVFCLINFGGVLLAVIVNNQPGQFPYIILLGHSFNDRIHQLRIADIRYDFSPHM